MRFKIEYLYDDEIDKLGLEEAKEVYRIRTRDDFYTEFQKSPMFYSERYGTKENYFAAVKKTCSRDSNVPFYDVIEDKIIQYEYNYYIEINSLEDLAKLEDVIGGFYISIKNKTISVHEE